MTQFRASRRIVLLSLAGTALLAAGGGYAALSRDHFVGDALTPPEAHLALQAGSITMIDIRRPDEWDRTGIAEGAYPIDMRREDFIDALLEATNRDRDTPVALICARGVRSDRMSARLTEAGFTQIIDVPEGMLGSTAGPGWLERQLPVVQP